LSKTELKKTKRKKPDAKLIDTKHQSDQVEEDPKISFDFGGLPVRDLKKNLGCG
jgi:hypothetical protein